MTTGGEQRTTFLAHVRALAARSAPGRPLPDGGYPLPDADLRRGSRVMPDAVWDGVRSQHAGVDVDEPTAVALAREIGELVAGPPTEAGLRHLHDTAAEHDLLQIADAITKEMAGLTLPRDRVREVGRRLAEHGTRRNAVALGVLLLGVSGDRRDRELLLDLGSLEDLTLYAAVALTRTQPDRERVLFDLARRVTGWGRIHTVQRLKGTKDPQIKAWLLREGFRNSIMDEYLAHLAATTGGLRAALAGGPVDDELLDGAGDILTALSLGGPAEDLTDYADGPEVIDRYLTLVQQRPPTLHRVATVLELSTDAGRSGAWRAVVDEALDSPDLDVVRQAIRPAKELGIPFRDRVRARLGQHPNDGYLWQTLLDDIGDIDDVLALAHELLPLDQLADGPSLDVGHGYGRPEHVLDLIVGRLDAHPGKGWPLIRAALRNPAIRNRNMAVRALDAWPKDTVPDEVVAALRRAGEQEPDPEVAGRMRDLLTTWTVSTA
ncbi:hypothetical protein [Actinoplanes sp. N902-109]|uniref:hypothetical protein n=1 Tax=Actinoplanes sp. (strain N902-109) TaxID=649831 RepID=UPI00032942D3|nr:hypothetical protein [Actinoplanes sp. N902-109]AGL15711.1 hypothetical protein L083_2201 [Actinoplanes sp. N902-109]